MKGNTQAILEYIVILTIIVVAIAFAIREHFYPALTDMFRRASQAMRENVGDYLNSL